MASDSATKSLPATSNNSGRPSLMTLPPEIRLEILRYCLRTDRNRSASWNVNILDNETFAMKLQSATMTSCSILPVCWAEDISYQLNPCILRVCAALLEEGRILLYKENSWIAIMGWASFGIEQRLEEAGLHLSWRQLSKSNSQLVRRRRGTDKSLDGYAPALTLATITSTMDEVLPTDSPPYEASNSEVQLVPLREVDLVVRTMWKGLAFTPRHGALQIIVGPQLPQDFMVKTLVSQRILPWLRERTARLLLGSVDLSQNADELTRHINTSDPAGLRSIRTGIFVDLFVATSLSPAGTCHLEGLEALGRDMYSLSINVNNSRDAVTSLMNITSQVQSVCSAGLDRIVMLRAFLPTVWTLVHLPCQCFDLADHDDDHDLACRRYQLYLSVWLKHSLVIMGWSLESTALAVRLELHTRVRLAQLYHSFSERSLAWTNLFSATILAIHLRSGMKIGEDKYKLALEMESELINVVRGKYPERSLQSMEEVRDACKAGDQQMFLDVAAAWAEHAGYADPMAILSEVLN